ncbi:MAG: phosphate acetyltransferase [Fusobacteria bacterium]|nr:phosphate acetyltransferase [Fusobacteriota bacterium]
MTVIENILERAKSKLRTIVLPEPEDERVLRATEKIIKEKIAKIILIGDESEIKEDAKKIGICLDSDMITIINPKKFDKINEYAEEFTELRKKRGVIYEDALRIMTTDSKFFGAMMVRKGDADGMVAGSVSSTADVLRASIQVVKAREGLKTVSSCFILETKATEYGENGVIIFSDCGVVPNPDSSQLADIAESAAESAVKLLGAVPKVALLSFSTMGSAKHENVDKVTNTLKILDERKVDFEYDGELQGDAAIVPSIALKKAPYSKVAGNANVLVFPNLDAGNIAYKLVERLAKANAYGPLIQGLSKPINDLSRGCNVDDIVNVVAITSIEVE